ncbi:MAG: hypothetical protein TEF_05905 [Rhizobiales bacterium NRL2]|jgi:acyl dehydratase|nr:MAG: hypothetical protein TEF_05905 [Rhizobiales bacterium NRL2]
MSGAIAYEVAAFNTATASENRIHDDSVAKKFGFQGGLVPGVDVYAYMTRAAVIRFGAAFLARGMIECRFGKPLYDGETARIEARDDADGRLAIALSARDTELAHATAWLAEPAEPPLPEQYPTAELPAPDARPPASAQSLPEGAALGTIRETADGAGQQSYRADVRETHPLYTETGAVHPGFLLRRANSALKDNVRLGPWIHVGSTVRHFAPLQAGGDLETRARVARRYDHKGHGFVELDVALFSEGRAIARIDHVAIYEPRQVRMSA